MVPLQYYCLLNLCPPFTPVPPGPVPVPQPLPIPSGGGGAAGGGAGLFVTFPGYKDPYKDEEAVIVEGELVEADVQEAEALQAAARVLGTDTQPRIEKLPPEDLIDRLIREAGRRVDIEDAEGRGLERGREERDWQAQARLLAARLYADLQARQAQRERDDWVQQLQQLAESLRQSEQRAATWQRRWEDAQQARPIVRPATAPMPLVPLAALPPPSLFDLEDPAVRRVWVGASVTAAVASAAVFSLFVLGLATEK